MIILIMILINQSFKDQRKIWKRINSGMHNRRLKKIVIFDIREVNGPNWMYSYHHLLNTEGCVILRERKTRKIIRI